MLVFFIKNFAYYLAIRLLRLNSMDDSIDHNLKKSFLRRQTCFLQLTDDEIDRLAMLLNEKHFPAGETIVTEGDPVDSVYLIVKGTADVRLSSVVNQSIETRSIATLNPGDAIGLNETGFYSLSGKRTATVVALTDMVTLYLNVAEFHGFALEYSHVNEVMRKNAEMMK